MTFASASRRLESRGFYRIMQLVALVPLASIIIAGITLVLLFPLELEQREGTSWLYTLAGRAGVPLYDATKVAFLNMNHGPLDPLLKIWLGRLFPFLTAPMVTRFFAVCLPAVLICFVKAVSRRSWRFAFLAGGIVYLGLVGLQPPHFLIGRSDPCATLFLSLLLCAVDRLEARASSLILWAAVSGVMSWATLLTNWRFVPGVVCAYALVAGEIALQSGARFAAARFFRIASLFIVVGAGALMAIVRFEFGGEWRSYYRHFFGFFSPKSGWGTHAADSFTLLPSGLAGSNGSFLLAVLALLGASILWRDNAIRREAQVKVWLPLLVLLWVTCSLGYYLNHSGAGYYYYGIFYILLAFYFMRSFRTGSEFPPWPVATAILMVYSALPWTIATRQVLRLAANWKPASDFLADVDATTKGHNVYSEDLFFFAKCYDGEVIDMGDVVGKVAGTGYFGPSFQATVARHYAWLDAHPPKYILTGGLGSAYLKAILRADYAPVLRAPSHFWPYAGPPATLYARKSVAADTAPRQD